MSDNKNQGGGNRAAAKEYNEKTQEFVDNNTVEELARDAEPNSPEEKEELRQAERRGKEKSKR